MASFDLKRLSRLDRSVVVAAAVALIALFLPWYGASVAGFSASVSGWSTGYGWVGGLLLIAGGVLLALQRSEVDLPKTRLTPAAAVLACAVVGTVVVVLRLATLPSGSGGVSGLVAYSYGSRVGIWIALAAGVVEAVAAYRILRVAGERLPWEHSEVRAGAGEDATAESS